ncbi:DUF397 domain-containing protein [Streptomyces chlorus]|uniref:DUF397 domain-containing protein n=1 Tax=Streptomyces chlorus TaxID=887452 RepID=A0ABW1E152_9ACTN
MNTGESFPPSSEATWFKSSYSGAEGGECVEIAEAHGEVLIRDSKRTRGPVLAVGAEAWAGFVEMTAGR